ncbi:MAG: flagellar type III secretion system pore protein FliP [Eubacterium sp.]|jgi:flagellar biosynthetic protein FliP|nr:flagellar type III secretion system pore protein FliP [Eubacterium sp.]
MSKFKKLYCALSVIFAVVILFGSIVLLKGQTVYATGTTNNPPLDYDQALDGIKAPTGDDIEEPSDRRNRPLGNATSDSTNGVFFGYNNEEGTLSGSIRILLVLTIISLAPSLLIMVTSFTRISIVLHFLRTAVGTQTSPPNQVLIGLALFLTFFIMQPVFSEINEKAIKPFDAGEITQEEAIEIGSEPLREFMNGQVQTKDIDLFIQISGETYESYEEVPFSILIPSFVISELRTAFIIGFLLYIPFIVIDMVVSSVLMSMGMMMLPPTTISMPFKILLFILADGWNMVIGSLVKTFY